MSDGGHTCNKEYQLKSMEDKIDDMHEMMKGIDTCIRGNGKAGLITQVALLDQNVQQLKNSDTGGVSKITLAGIGTAIASLVYGLAEGLKALIGKQ